MELGQRIKEARLEVGLSQRQLCGDVITRNMLSQIENGLARPSMDTLSYFAARLGKSVSFFLEEDTVTSPNQNLMQQAREACRAGNWEAAVKLLEGYRAPDDTFDWEKELLWGLAHLALARQALEEKRLPYVRHLLGQIAADAPYCGLLEPWRQLLLAKTGGETALPNIDEVLILKAERALTDGDSAKAAVLLEAAEDHTCAKWQYLRGESCFAQGQFQAAAVYFAQVEEVFPNEVIPKLEQCYSALEDYKMAYLYACKQKK